MLISFEISSQGVTLVDPHKRTFSRKAFDVKLITYVARIRYVSIKALSTVHCFIFLLFMSEITSLLLCVRAGNLTAMSLWKQR